MFDNILSIIATKLHFVKCSITCVVIIDLNQMGIAIIIIKAVGGGYRFEAILILTPK